MSTTVEQYVEKISRITTEYKQLVKKEANYSKGEDITLPEISERKLEIYKYIKNKASKCKEKSIAVATLDFTPKMFKYLPVEFKHDKAFFLETLKELNAPKLLKYSDKVIKTDIECCMEAIKRDHRVYYHVHHSLQNDPKILNIYEWRKELSRVSPNISNINLSNHGPDEDDKYFYDSKLKKDSRNEGFVIEEINDEPDYTNNGLIDSSESDDDEPDYEEQEKYTKESMDDANKYSETEDLGLDDYEEEQTLMPEFYESAEKVKENKKQQKGIFGFLYRFFN